MSARSRVGEILVRAQVIDELQLRSALASQDQWGGRIARVVIDLGLAEEDVVTEAIAKATGTPRVRLGNLTRDGGALGRIDVGFAEQKGVFPVALKDGGKLLQVAVADPTDLELLDQVQMKARAKVQLAIAGELEIERAIAKYYRNQELPSGPPTRRGPAPASAAGDDEEEFKIVDMAGKTVVRKLTDLVSPEEAAKLQAAAPAPAASAANLLDEILSGGSAGPTESFTAEEQQRLEALRANQEKSSKILRALLELLLEKSTFSQKELAARVKAG